MLSGSINNLFKFTDDIKANIQALCCRKLRHATNMFQKRGRQKHACRCRPSSSFKFDPWLCSCQSHWLWTIWKHHGNFIENENNLDLLLCQYSYKQYWIYRTNLNLERDTKHIWRIGVEILESPWGKMACISQTTDCISVAVLNIASYQCSHSAILASRNLSDGTSPNGPQGPVSRFIS
jgi:hypothetical protein